MGRVNMGRVNISQGYEMYIWPGHEGSSVIGRSLLFGVSIKREFTVYVSMDATCGLIKL